MANRMFFWIVVVALLGGCATHYSWRASVPVRSSVRESCLAAALDSEKDVFDVTRTGEARFAFRLELPDVKRDDSPSFSLHTLSGDGGPTLNLSTAYAEGAFERSSNAQLLHARALVVRVTEECTGRQPTLGEPQPCGAGEPNDLCVRGRY